MAEYGGLDALFFTRYRCLFPILLWLERLMLRIWPYFQSVGLGLFFTFFFHWFLPYFEALVFSLTYLGRGEFFPQGINLS